MGRDIAAGLRKIEGYSVVSISRRADERAGIQSVDVKDAAALTAVMSGADAVIHMAYYLGSDEFISQIVPNNIIGTFNVYEAARINKVKRVIFFSSNHVFGFYPREDHVSDDSEYRPDSLYGVSKCFCESLGRYYSDRYGISVFNIRIGNYPGDTPPKSARSCRQWLSARDAVSLMDCCVKADPDILYARFPGVSANDNNLWDISALAEFINYRPIDNGAEHLRADTPDDETPFKGGMFPFFGPDGKVDEEALKRGSLR